MSRRSALRPQAVTAFAVPLKFISFGAGTVRQWCHIKSRPAGGGVLASRPSVTQGLLRICVGAREVRVAGVAQYADTRRHSRMNGLPIEYQQNYSESRRDADRPSPKSRLRSLKAGAAAKAGD